MYTCMHVCMYACMYVWYVPAKAYIHKALQGLHAGLGLTMCIYITSYAVWPYAVCAWTGTQDRACTCKALLVPN